MWNRITLALVMTKNFAMYIHAAGCASSGALPTGEFRALSSVND